MKRYRVIMFEKAFEVNDVNTVGYNASFDNLQEAVDKFYDIVKGYTDEKFAIYLGNIVDGFNGHIKYANMWEENTSNIGYELYLDEYEEIYVKQPIILMIDGYPHLNVEIKLKNGKFVERLDGNVFKVYSECRYYEDSEDYYKEEIEYDRDMIEWISNGVTIEEFEEATRDIRAEGLLDN